MAEANPEGVIVVATTRSISLTFEHGVSGLPCDRLGDDLDTAASVPLATFRGDPRSVTPIVGEHGDSEVPVWSLANIAGMRLADFCAAQGVSLDEEAMAEIFRQTRDAAYQIIERKGATYYAIGAALLRLLEAILRDQDTVLSVSSRIEDYYGVGGIAFSLPRREPGGPPGPAASSTRRAEGRRSADVLQATIAQLDAG
jgi:L-lactate dehydrogenase